MEIVRKEPWQKAVPIRSLTSGSIFHVPGIIRVKSDSIYMVTDCPKSSDLTYMTCIDLESGVLVDFSKEHFVFLVKGKFIEE